MKISYFKVNKLLQFKLCGYCDQLKLSGGNSNKTAKACGPQRHIYLPSPEIKGES